VTFKFRAVRAVKFPLSGTEGVGLACHVLESDDKVDISRAGERCAPAVLEYS
jgi:hypothetical protein